MHFNYGDKVRAHQGAPYGITTNGWTGYVTGMSDDSIAVHEHREGFEGSSMWVDPAYFDLVEPAAVREFTMDLMSVFEEDVEREV